MSDVGDATVCECGHRFDEHGPDEYGAPSCGSCKYAMTGGWRHRFEPAEPELSGTALSQAVDRRRGL